MSSAAVGPPAPPRPPSAPVEGKVVFCSVEDGGFFDSSAFAFFCLSSADSCKLPSASYSRPGGAGAFAVLVSAPLIEFIKPS